eukprot:767543-Hanusia_phi.AAC.2
MRRETRGKEGNRSKNGCSRKFESDASRRVRTSGEPAKRRDSPTTFANLSRDQEGDELRDGLRDAGEASVNNLAGLQHVVLFTLPSRG